MCVVCLCTFILEPLNVSYIHAYTHTYTHKYIHAHVHTCTHTCMKNTCATLSFQTSCSEQNSALWRKIFSTCVCMYVYTCKDTPTYTQTCLEQKLARCTKEITAEGDESKINKCEHRCGHAYTNACMHTYMKIRTHTHTNHGVMRLIPINACHGHEDRNVSLECLVVLFQALLDGLVVARDAGVLDLNTCMRTCLQSNVRHA